MDFDNAGQYLLPHCALTITARHESMDYGKWITTKRMSQKQDGRFKMVKYIFEEDRLYDCYTLGNSDNNLLPGQRHTGRSDAGGHQGASRAVVENLKARWGLDKPMGEQYVIYLKNLLHGGNWESLIGAPGLTARIRLLRTVFRLLQGWGFRPWC